LTWARGRFPTPHGEIAVAWERSEGRFELTVGLPQGVEALVRLPDLVPDEATVEVLGAGPAVWTPAGWEVEAPAGGELTVRARW
ncbi:MAG TPA: alpha-L-rhamnosidase, partial [Caldilineae bacterium]|nr:alpha-L-rhamnosidase [Caldilineae bacterium]